MHDLIKSLRISNCTIFQLFQQLEVKNTNIISEIDPGWFHN